jgi:hypothetical protein
MTEWERIRRNLCTAMAYIDPEGVHASVTSADELDDALDLLQEIRSRADKVQQALMRRLAELRAEGLPPGLVERAPAANASVSD